MKKYTNVELKAIIKELKSGVVYCGIDNYNRGIGNIFYDDNLIKWNHYGSSANKCNIDGLKFILESIFEKCSIITKAKYSEYHINYIPIDENYIGIDVSNSHPNTFGL